MARRSDPYPIGTLFADLTVALERAHSIAVKGQSPGLGRAAQRRFLHRLQRMLGRLQPILGAIAGQLDQSASWEAPR